MPFNWWNIRTYCTCSFFQICLPNWKSVGDEPSIIMEVFKAVPALMWLIAGNVPSFERTVNKVWISTHAMKRKSHGKCLKLRHSYVFTISRIMIKHETLKSCLQKEMNPNWYIQIITYITLITSTFPYFWQLKKLHVLENASGFISIPAGNCKARKKISLRSEHVEK